MNLGTRIAKLEEKSPGCPWCARGHIWLDDEVKVVEGRYLCPHCGADRTGYVKIVERELWEALRP